MHLVQAHLLLICQSLGLESFVALLFAPPASLHLLTSPTYIWEFNFLEHLVLNTVHFPFSFLVHLMLAKNGIPLPVISKYILLGS